MQVTFNLNEFKYSAVKKYDDWIIILQANLKDKYECMLKYCKCICDEYTYVICAYRYKMMKRFFLPHIGILKSFQRKRRLTFFFLLYLFSSSLVKVSVTKRNGFSGMKNQSRLNIYWKNETYVSNSSERELDVKIGERKIWLLSFLCVIILTSFA